MTKGRIKTSIMSMILVGLMNTSVIHAANEFEGNDSNTNIESEKHENFDKIKIEGDLLKDGEHDILDGRMTVTFKEKTKKVSVVSHDDGLVVNYVHVKGGNKFICYNRDDSFNDLTAPDNKDISHVTIFYAEKGGEVVPPPETGDSTLFVPIAVTLGSIGVLVINNRKNEK